MEELKRTIINSCRNISKFKRKYGLEPEAAMDVEIFGILQKKNYNNDTIRRALNELFQGGEIMVSEKMEFRTIIPDENGDSNGNS